MTHPSTQPYSAGAHGLRRNPGQSVNLAHPFWRNPCAPAPLSGHLRRVFLGGAMGVGLPLQSLRDSFPMNGEAASPNCLRLPLPHSWGSSGDAGEGVFPLRTPLLQAMPPQRPCSSVGAQAGALTPAHSPRGRGEVVSPLLPHRARKLRVGQ